MRCNNYTIPMRMKLYTLLCIFFFLLFTACNQDDDPVPPEVGSRTVLVYIVADNNLSSFAKEDVEEMIAGMESVDLSSSNLLVYQDDRVAPVLFRISKNKKGRLEKEIIKEYAEQVSTKASVMKEVMHRAFYEYPADSYGLVYWSHADGWIPYPVPSASTRWIGQDTGEGQDNRMNISDFVDVLDDGMPHFDFIIPIIISVRLRRIRVRALLMTRLFLICLNRARLHKWQKPTLIIIRIIIKQERVSRMQTGQAELPFAL